MPGRQDSNFPGSEPHPVPGQGHTRDDVGGVILHEQPPHLNVRRSQWFNPRGAALCDSRLNSANVGKCLTLKYRRSEDSGVYWIIYWGRSRIRWGRPDPEFFPLR